MRESLALGTNFTRPAAIELECAERFLEIVDGADMVKFTKDGSTAITAAVKLARAYTGRELVALCADHPFFSYDDWFIGTTRSRRGHPAVAIRKTYGRSTTTTSTASRHLFDGAPGPDRRGDPGAGADRGAARRVPRRRAGPLRTTRGAF